MAMVGALVAGDAAATGLPAVAGEAAGLAAANGEAAVATPGDAAGAVVGLAAAAAVVGGAAGALVGAGCDADEQAVANVNRVNSIAERVKCLTLDTVSGGA